MPSERVRRQIDGLLDEAEQAIRESNWSLVQQRCRQILALDPGNNDANAYLAAAERGLNPTQSGGAGISTARAEGPGATNRAPTDQELRSATSVPQSFASS